MAAQLLPISPPNAIQLGDDYFVTISEFNQAIRVHIRKYLRNAVTFTATPHGVSFIMDDWRLFSNQLDFWKTQMEDRTCSSSGVLFSCSKFAITNFELDGIKTISFVLANRKQVDLSLKQFQVLCTSIDTLEDWHDQISGSGSMGNDSQIF
jgi:hypothetical protein